MIKKVSSLLWGNLGIYSVMIILFNISAFLEGFGAGSRHLTSEKKLLAIFIAIHLAIIFFIVILIKKRPFSHFILLVIQTCLLWGFAALCFY